MARRALAMLSVSAVLLATSCGGSGTEPTDASTGSSTTVEMQGAGSPGMISQVQRARDVASDLDARNTSLEDGG